MNESKNQFNQRNKAKNRASDKWHFKEAGWKFERWLDLIFMQLIL
jgi:hypothetical protein